MTNLVYNRAQHWAYVAVVALGIALALPGLDRIPFTQGDDATYFTTIRSLHVLLSWARENEAVWGDEKIDVASLKDRFEQAGLEFILPYYSKPFFDLIYWGAIGVWGERLQAILYANLIFFVLAIWLMARVGEMLFKPEIGLMAALFLATSGSALVYTRTGMAHMASLAIFMVGAFFFLRAYQEDGFRARRLLLPGMAWGICLSIHPNLLPYIGLCGVANLLHCHRFQGGAEALKESAWLVFGMLCVAFAVEAVYRVWGEMYQGIFIAAGDWQIVPFRTYFEQMTLHAQTVMDGGITPIQKIYTYLLLFWAHEGLLVCALIGLSTAMWLRKRNDYKLLFVLTLFWIPLLFFLASRNQAVYRYAAGIILPASLLAAIALERVLQQINMRRIISPQWASIWVVFAVTVVNIAHVRPIYAVESAWSSTAQWLQQRNEAMIISTSGGTLWAVNGIENIDPTQGGEKVRYLALYKRYKKRRELDVLAQRGRTNSPVFQAPHLRPDKLLEVDFLSNNLILDGLGILPGIGSFTDDMRGKALEMNRLHFIEVYELNNGNGPAVERVKCD